VCTGRPARRVAAKQRPELLEYRRVDTGWVMSGDGRVLPRRPGRDRWLLIRETLSDCVLVRDEPNLLSGGKPSVVEVGGLLSRGNGSAQQVLLRLIGSLVEADGRSEVVSHPQGRSLRPWPISPTYKSGVRETRIAGSMQATAQFMSSQSGSLVTTS